MTITLDLPPDQTAALLQLNNRFQHELEQQAFPAAATLSSLKTALTEALDRQPGALKILDDALHRPGTLRLVAADTRLRNLPWHLALEDRPLLSLVKTHRADLPEHQPAVGLPLKVLVMVSAPEGATRLDYEAEELSLLHAFAPLMSRGLAQVHFTDDGSLENLQEKLAENRYHVLHFSGHGTYKDEKGSLLLENAETGKAELVGARDFNEALQKNRRKGYCPDLVVLSACQSAQGGQVGDLQGVADELLAGGVPAVVAMSTSILDVCATEFTAALYANLAEGTPLPAAFLDALRHLREFEIARLRRPENAAPGQWLIPQLLVSAGVENLYDKNQKAEELSFTDSKYVRGDDNLLQLRGGVDRKKYGYVFIGRRAERRFALARLRNAERPAVLLRGQGGVGKTALAEHLAVRMLAANPKIKVFTRSERAPALESLVNQLRDYLTKEKRQLSVVTDLARIEKLSDKFIFLVQKAGEYCDPMFIFDNVESFQKDPGGDWNLEKYEDVFYTLDILLQHTAFPVILTGRYPLREFPGLAVRDLNAVSFGDFYKKCWQLPMHRLADRLSKGSPSDDDNTLWGEGQGSDSAPTFEHICQTLHRAFGGNYRALEFFDELYTQRGDAVFGTLERVDGLPADTTDDVRRRIGENLVFGELLALLDPDEKEALALLSKFRIPVLPMALGMQRNSSDFTIELDRLADLTLVERDTDRDGKKWFHVMPLVKDLLTESGLSAIDFSEKAAGNYHDYLVQHNLTSNILTDNIEAFEWFFSAGDVEKVNNIGLQLQNIYIRTQQFRQALMSGLRAEEIAKGETDGRIWNNLGLLLNIFGRLGAALPYYEKAFEDSRKRGNKSSEGDILNNISQVYHIRGDYDHALDYLLQSLKIRQEIGDLQGEGATLNNISQIYHVRGDYDQSLIYLLQSLKIRQEIGDRQGEGATLNNISQIYHVRGDYDQALVYLLQSLKIRQEIGDKLGEGTTLNNISQIFDAKGDYDLALDYLQQSLKIRQEIGDRLGEGATLNNVSQIYIARRDYDRALDYLQQSLKIRQEIGDRLGEGATLNNVSQIYIARGDYERGLDYLQQSLKIRQEIGDRLGEGTTLNNISQIYIARGDYDSALKFLKQSLKIRQEIGDAAGMSSTLHNIAIIHLQQKSDVQEFTKNEEEAFRLALEIGNTEAIHKIGKTLGNVLCQFGQIDLGLRTLRIALDAGKKTGGSNLGEVESAIQRFSSVIELNPITQ